MSSEEKRDEIAAVVEPVFRGGPLWRRPAGKVLILWVPMTIIGVLLALYAPRYLFPANMSVEQEAVRTTFIFFTALAAPVAAVVWGIALYSIVGWRKKSGKSDTPPEDGPPIRGGTIATTIWLGTSVVLVVVLLVWGMAELSSELAPQQNAMQVNVTGQQWQWTFSYPGTGVTSTQLIVPEGRQIHFHVTSEDVTHGFWPVQLGVQIDANPNVTTLISATPNVLGTFDVRCSQLCGLNHAYMQTTGTTVTQAQFNAWLVSRGASATSVHSYAMSAK